MAVPLSSSTYQVLDGLSALLTVAIGLGFLILARKSRRLLHAAVGIGFCFMAVGFLFVAASHFQRTPDADASDVLRVACQLLGSLTLFMAYASAQASGRPRPAVIAYGALGATVALAVLLWWLPPSGVLPPLPEYVAVAYSLMAVSYLGCTILSGVGWHRRPSLARALVPLGFLCWTLSTYTWIFIALGAGDEFLPVVYAWRFTAIALILSAMLGPTLPKRGA